MSLDIHIHLPMSDIEKMVMLDDDVLIEVFDKRSMTNSGIAIPITIDNPFVPSNGTVYKKAESVKCFDIGDKVIIEKYKGQRIYSNDMLREFILLDFSYVLCKILD